jgi:hypothetical protein
MPAFGAGIHAFPSRAKAWMAGPSPAMTVAMIEVRGRKKFSAFPASLAP